MKDLLPGKTYMFFSHTHKGQSYNMPMLKNILDKVRFLEFHSLESGYKRRHMARKSDFSTTNSSKMSISSDWFNLVALLGMQVGNKCYFFLENTEPNWTMTGMVDGLHSLGRRLLGLGYGSPFLAIGMSYMYRCLADARLDVVRSGLVIQDDGLPKELGPMTFVFTGNGNVTRVRGFRLTTSKG